MKMNGVVHTINRKRGMVAIQTDGYGFTIIELLSDDEIDVGDRMHWENDTGLGDEKYRNVTKGTFMDVYVQNHWVTPAQLRQQLRME
jgi:hypothetical protein